jgi:hypothetical protein
MAEADLASTPKKALAPVNQAAAMKLLGLRLTINLPKHRPYR